MRPSHYGAGNQKKKFFRILQIPGGQRLAKEPGDSGYGLCLKVHTSDDE